MAKKSGGSGIGYNKLAGILALVSIFISGVIYLIMLILKLVNGSANFGVLTIVATVCMLLAVVMISWKALRSAKLPGKRMIWYVLYWVFVILILVGQIALV